jgi:hypothetical protein
MVLTRRFNRGFLFIAFAASFGMFAQEMVSRILFAGDHPAAQASASSRSWRSAESYYSKHPGVRRAQAPPPSEASLSGLAESAVEEPAVEESAIEEFVARTVVEPDENSSMEEQVSDVAPNPTESWGAATNGSDGTLTDEPTVPDSYQFAAADEPPPVTERRPASIPSLVPTQTAELPPPEVRTSESQQPDSEMLLPPNPPQRVRGPMDVAKSDPDYPLLQNPDPSAHSHTRYADPAELRRQRGIERGQQLQRRIELQRLLGYYPSRPPVEASPFTSGDPIRPVVIIVPRTVVVQQR